MIKKNPLVSVYIANHNYGKYLKKAIDSVLNQTFKDFELIIIDDGSTDNSHKIIKKYKKEKKIITVFQKNKGLTVTNNVALRLSKGEFIMRLDADDWLDSNALQILSDKLRKNKKLGLVFPDYYEVNPFGKIINVTRRHNFKKVSLRNQPAHGACTMIRKECLEKIGGYSEKFDRQDGYYIWIKFIQRYEVANVNLPLFFYRQHNLSLTKDENKIFKTRSEIINFNAKQKLSKKTLAILAVRGFEINPNTEVLKKLKKKPLLEWIIDSVLNAKQISKLIVTSPDLKILNFLKKKYKKKILYHKREQKLGGINVEIDDTLKKAMVFSKYKGIKFDYIFQLTYKTPFLKSNDIDSFINLMEIFKTDQVLAVRSEIDKIYKHNGKGLTLLNESSNLKLERDEIYRGIAGIRLFKKNLIKKKNKNNIKGHYILDQKSSHVINTQLDWKIAEALA